MLTLSLVSTLSLAAPLLPWPGSTGTPGAGTFAAGVLAAAVLATALLRRAPRPAFTLLWQVRVPLAALASFVACGAFWLGATLPAWLLVGAVVPLSIRVGSEQVRARRRVRFDGPHATLNVLTHNCGLHRSNPQRIADFLADSGADVIGVQEIEPAHALAFAEQLRVSHPHQAHFATGVDGVGILSRYPLRDARLERLGADHPYLLAEVETPFGDVRMVVFHPPASLAWRGAGHPAVRDLARLAREAVAAGPAIVMGDLNSTSATAAHDVFTSAGLVDAFAGVGQGTGVTFPVPFRYLGVPTPPFVRIDFVFMSPEFAPLLAEVGPPTSSDHLPLFATVARRREAREASDAGGDRQAS